MAVKTGIGAAIYVASLPSVAFTDVAANPDADYKIYTISDAAKRYWDKAVAVVVESSTNVGAATPTWTQETSGFSVQHVGGKIIFAAATTTAVTGEAVGTGGGLTTTFKLAHSPVVPNSQTVYVAGVAKTEGTDYTFDDWTGTITFATAPAAGAAITANYTYYKAVRVDGAYLPISQLGEAKEWTLDADVKILDATKLGDAWEVKVAGQKSASVKLSRWWIDGFFLGQLTNPLVVVLYVDSTAGTRYEGYARLKSDSVKTAADALVEEDISLEIDGEVYYVAA